MEIVIIGSGNVATILGKKLLDAGNPIRQVISRQEGHAARLAEALHSRYAARLEDLDQEADLYLLSLSDDALYAAAATLRLPGKLVVHTAGAVPLRALLPVSERCGVLYPLQSLRKEISPIPEIPLLVDASQPGDRSRIADLARSISSRVHEAGDETRLKLHVSAILVNNFTNHLYTIAEDYCRSEQLDFSLLHPLIRETGERLSRFSPRKVQTGPAVRGDRSTMDKHIELLSGNPEATEIYKLFSSLITSFYQGPEKASSL